MITSDHTQEKIVLGALLVVPLFLGNSARHPAWQMVFSAPAFAVIGYIIFYHYYKILRTIFDGLHL